MFLCISSLPELLSDLKLLKAHSQNKMKQKDSGCHERLPFGTRFNCEIRKPIKCGENAAPLGNGCVDIPGSTAHVMGGSG